MTTPSDSEVSEELKAIAYLSMRTGQPIPVLMDLDPLYIAAYWAVLSDEAAAHRK